MNRADGKSVRFRLKGALKEAHARLHLVSLEDPAGQARRGGDAPYRPMIISQVVIKPGVRTIFNITMKPGDELERVTSPQMETQQISR